MLTTRFLPHSADINTGADVSAWINQIESTGHDAGVTLFEESGGSETDREFVAAKDITPTISLVTSDLAILTTVGMSGVPISSGASKPGVVLFGRELPFGAVPTAIATAHHLKCTVSDGLLIPQSLRAAHNQAAKLTLMLHATLGSDGTSGATPMVFAASQAITSGAGATTNIYTTGPLKYTISGGASRYVQGVSDVSVNFGIQELKESDSGEVYPTQIGIVSRMPKIEFSTKDTALIAEIGDGISVSSFATYFRKVSANGQRVAPATTTHVSIIGTAGMVTPGTLTLQHKQAGSVGFTFTPAKNTQLFTISIAAAIPTS